VGIATAESNGYIISVTVQTKILTVTSFSLPVSPKMEPVPSFLLLTLKKSETVTSLQFGLLKRYNCYIVLVTNIKLKLLHHPRFWAPKKVVGF
jgi:hypothetical protein